MTSASPNQTAHRRLAWLEGIMPKFEVVARIAFAPDKLFYSESVEATGDGTPPANFVGEEFAAPRVSPRTSSLI